MARDEEDEDWLEENEFDDDPLEPIIEPFAFLLPTAERFYIPGADTGQYWAMLDKLTEPQLTELRQVHARLARVLIRPENAEALTEWWYQRLHAAARSRENRDDIAYQLERLSDLLHQLAKRGVEPFASKLLTCFGEPGKRVPYDGPPAKCEATLTQPVECAIPRDSGPPFLLSHEAADRLEHRALRPIEWLRLTARHGRSDYWLWPYFYSDKGFPYQASIYVEAGHRIPALAELRKDIDLLLDYAATRDSGTDDKIDEAILAFGRDAVVKALVRRTGLPADQALGKLKTPLVLRLLGEPEATQWLAARWQHVTEQYEVGELARATAQRIGAGETVNRIVELVERTNWPGGDDNVPPVHDGLPGALSFMLADHVPSDMLLELVISLLDRLSPRRKGAVADVLNDFRSPLALDWLEQHADRVYQARNETEVWGKFLLGTLGAVATLNGLDWPRAVKWLNRSSLFAQMALEGMANCRPFEPEKMAGLFREGSPTIAHAPPLTEIEQILKTHALAHPDPKTLENVGLILMHADHIFRRVPHG